MTIVALLVLTGCNLDRQLEKSFCIEYESAWQDFIEARADADATPINVIEASQELRNRWQELLDRDGTPWDVHDMVSLADSSFVDAWNASTTSERLRYQESWTNGRDYIGMRCADSGFPIEFGGDDVPVQAPRVTEP